MLYPSFNAPGNTDDPRSPLVYGVAREAGQYHMPLKGYALLGAVEIDQVDEPINSNHMRMVKTDRFYHAPFPETDNSIII
jgi:hypothetical protein